MKRIVILCAAAVLVLLGVSACGESKADSSDAQPVVVTVKDMRYTPSTVTIKPGQAVEWKFEDGGMPHNVNSDDGLFKNDLVTSGTFKFTFDKAGTYKYHCDPHPYMTGTVIVQG